MTFDYWPSWKYSVAGRSESFPSDSVRRGAVTLIPILVIVVVLGFVVMFALRGRARQAERDHSGPGGRTPPPGNLKDREIK